MINLTINGIEVSVEEGTTILKAAKQAGIYIPTLCYDEAVAVYGACGLCVVEAEGIPKLLRSCSAKCSEGMVVNTEKELFNQEKLQWNYLCRLMTATA
jgi:formate dehydrogenase major subunit